MIDIKNIEIGDSIELSEEFYGRYPALQDDTGKLLIIGKCDEINTILVIFPQCGRVWSLDNAKDQVTYSNWTIDLEQFPCRVQTLNSTYYKYIINHHKAGVGTNTCVGCGEIFEYAEKVVGFKCWGCKSGY
jgi:hypothetical protein